MKIIKLQGRADFNWASKSQNQSCHYYQSIKRVNIFINQWELKVNTGNLPEARENPKQSWDWF